jgi:hypothetical protein
MGSPAQIFIIAVALCLAVFMFIVMGMPIEPTWWLFMLLTVAWNISPLIAARFRAARTGRSLLRLLMLVFALSYVVLGCVIYYRNLYPKPLEMNGFIVVFFPFAGWAGLIAIVACEALLSWVWMLWRRDNRPG